MSVNDLVLVQGIKDTRRTLAGWQRDPLAVVGVWLGWSFLIALALLCSVYRDRRQHEPGLHADRSFPGCTRAGDAMDVLHLLYRNGLVLALHAMACVAGFIAGSSLPLSAEKRTGRVALGPREGGPARDRVRRRRDRRSRS